MRCPGWSHFCKGQFAKFIDMPNFFIKDAVDKVLSSIQIARRQGGGKAIMEAIQIKSEQLAESYEYTTAIFDTIREAVIVLDDSFRVKSANKAFFTIFKVTEDQTEGKLIYELGNGQWDIPELHLLLEEIISRNTQFRGFEVRHNFPVIGEKIMLLNAQRIIQKMHRQQLILLAIEDITRHRHAQKLQEERELWFHNMADNAPVMIWVARQDKRRTFFNKTWLHYSGKHIEQAMGYGWEAELHPEDRAIYLEQYDKNFDARIPFEIEYRMRRHDGEYRWILDIAKPTFNPTGEFSGYIGSCTEIHDKKLIHEELERRVQARTYDLQNSNKDLDRSNSELQQFAYVASHDLQEPLRKIMTFTDRLQRFKKVLPEAGINYVDKIAESCDRMTSLIDELLNFSRITHVATVFEKTDLKGVLKQVLADLETGIQDKNAVIHFGNLPVIEAIPVLMKQLFFNLISNALKFSKEGVRPVITVSSAMLVENDINEFNNLDKSLTYVKIAVEDNGIGFNPDFSEQIFVIFQRLNYRENYPGTGIGLALCRKIVNNHNGEIFAVSKEGTGACFNIIIPVEQSRMNNSY